MRTCLLAFILLISTASLIEAQPVATLEADQFSEWNWRLLGPALPAGRAWKVVGVESDPKTLYVTTAGGGVWKTTNNGTTFDPIFNYESTASTGVVAVAPSNTDIVWVGTGEPANTRANSWGDGAYRSTDGGSTWEHMGLSDSFLINQIVIHPTDPDIVYVAAMGHLWGANEERGVFRTTDGGETWTKVLYINDTTGVIDLQMDPSNPDVLYASAWERFRYGGGDMNDAGPGSGIFKSTDGGSSWSELTNGLPTDHMGKIHLAVARGNTQIVYAAVLANLPDEPGRRSDQSGIYRSDDGGASWTKVNEKRTNYYYQHLYVDPTDDETVWMSVFELNRSIDGGRTWEEVNMRHVHNDLHSMWIDPNDPDHMAVSGDGGVSISYDRGATWQQTVLPIGQFYEVSVDNQDPYHVIGGMQDTGHWLGPHRTYDEEGITDADWYKMRYIGDGMASATDPRDPNIIYLVQQFGNTTRLDMRTWDRTELQPRNPDELIRKGATHRVRYNWTPAFILSRHNPDIVYLGSNYLFRINAVTADWEVISPDLTWQQDRSPRGVTDGYHSYGSLFSVAESPFFADMLWAGADDGPIWLTRNGGASWTQVDTNLPDGAPNNCVVAEIEASSFYPETAYVALDCHARDDLRPYLYGTSDGGRSWTGLATTLPKSGSAYVIREDPDNPDVLYVGTEFGVFISIDTGEHWVKLNGNLPTVGVRSMVIQGRDRDLIVGTFGRAIWVTDIGPMAELSSATLDKPLHLFKTEPATKFKMRVTFGNTIEEMNGDMFFRAENPATGTMITYYLREDQVDGVTITIRDNANNTVRTLMGPGTAGLNRVNWDMKTDASAADNERRRGMTQSEVEFSKLVPLGTYSIEVSAGSAVATGFVLVRAEPEGVQQASPRK